MSWPDHLKISSIQQSTWLHCFRIMNLFFMEASSDFFCLVFFVPSLLVVPHWGLEDHLQEGVACVLLFTQRSSSLCWRCLMDQSVHLTEQFVVLVTPGLDQRAASQQRLVLLDVRPLRTQLGQEVHEERSVEIFAHLIQNKPAVSS